MKFGKFKFLLFLLAFSAFIFNACEETTTPSDPAPNAPKNLMANSVDKTTIALKWTASTSETDALFKGYVVTIKDENGNMQSINLSKSQNPINITNLNEGKLYTFYLKAAFTNGKFSDSINIQWAPAERFKSDIRVYEYASKRGSGIQLFGEDGLPNVFTVANNDKWDLVLDTRNGVFEIGSPRASGYTDDAGVYTGGSKTLAKALDIIKVVENVSNLDDVFDSEAMGPLSAAKQKMIDFTAKTTGFVLYVKSYPINGDSKGNYAKIFVKAVGGKILQGTADDRYVQLEISYQVTKDLPHALYGNNEKPSPVEKTNRIINK